MTCCLKNPLKEELSRAQHHIEILNLEKNSFKAMAQALLAESQDNRDNQWVSVLSEKDKIIAALVRRQKGNEEVKQLEKLLIQEREAHLREKVQSERNLSQMLMQLSELKKVVVNLEKESEMNKAKIMEYSQSLQKQNHLRDDFIQLQEYIEQLQRKVEEIEAEKQELTRAIDTKQKRDFDNFDSQKIQAILSIEGQKQLEIEGIERQNAQLAELVLSLQDELAERQMPQDQIQNNEELKNEIQLQLNILFQLANQGSAFIKVLLQKHFGSLHDLAIIFADVSLYPSLILGLLLFVIDILVSVQNDHRIKPFSETARFDEYIHQSEDLNRLLLAPSIKDIQQKIALSSKIHHILENEITLVNKDDLMTEVSKQELGAPSIPQIDKDSFLMSNNNQQLFLAIQNEQQENYPNMMSQFLREDTQSSTRDNQKVVVSTDQSANLDIISSPSAFKTTQEFNPGYDDVNLKILQKITGRQSQNNENEGEKQESYEGEDEEELEDNNTVADE